MDRERKYRRLVRVEYGNYKILAEDDFVYVEGKDYLITIEAIGASLQSTRIDHLFLALRTQPYQKALLDYIVGEARTLGFLMSGWTISGKRPLLPIDSNLPRLSLPISFIIYIVFRMKPGKR